jgi:hypothetical protein
MAIISSAIAGMTETRFIGCVANRHFKKRTVRYRTGIG